jgi:hypothetical protein
MNYRKNQNVIPAQSAERNDAKHRRELMNEVMKMMINMEKSASHWNGFFKWN